jgi:hypothetical protein
MSPASIDSDEDIVDFARGLTENQKLRIVPADVVSSELIASAVNAFKYLGEDADHDIVSPSAVAACTIYEHKDFPGESCTHGPFNFGTMI